MEKIQQFLIFLESKIKYTNMKHWSKSHAVLTDLIILLQTISHPYLVFRVVPLVAMKATGVWWVGPASMEPGIQQSSDQLLSNLANPTSQPPLDNSPLCINAYITT